MTNDTVEEMKIWHLINAWGHARDSGDWDALQNCFCSDASIDIAWIKAPAKEFVARSIQMAANREPGAHQKHMFTGPLVRINGERAFSICHVQLEHRDTMQAYTFDLQSWFRFFDLLRKEEDGCWRIHPVQESELSLAVQALYH